MGLKNIIKRGVGALKGKEPSPAQQAESWKFKQEVYDAEQKGRLAGAKQKAYERGKQSGYGGNGAASRIGGALNTVGTSLSNAEKAFGFDSYTRGRSSSGGGFGGFGKLDFGLGFDQKPEKPPQRITKVSKSGAVTIIEPVETKQSLANKRKRRSGSMLDLSGEGFMDLNALDDNPLAY